jgi:hypothetical protein
MKTFEELGVSPEILKAIKEMGYENPMPVQEEVIPYLLGNGNDVVALAQTGTGKTAAFGLPLIQKVDVKHRAPQALILCPTRELCLQIARCFTSTFWISGRPNAAVFPVPVCARATTSLPFPNKYGITSSCTGMGFSYPISLIAFSISGETPNSSNVFIYFQISNSLQRYG